MEVKFFKLRDLVFKSVSDNEGLSAYVFDTSTKDWRPISIGALTEAEMYGREIEDPGEDYH